MDEYFRGDQKAGITAPNLAKPCDFHDHIVNARGRKTAYTSVSLDVKVIEAFGEIDYHLLRQAAGDDGHDLIEHAALLTALMATAKGQDSAQKAKAIQAIRYSTKRREGLIKWNFDISSVDKKDLITWAFGRVQKYFVKI